jgi:hypothetical protein
MDTVPTDIFNLILQNYLSNYTWDKLILHIFNEGDSSIVEDFQNLTFLKCVSKSTYNIFCAWNQDNWYFGYTDTSLFNYNLDSIEEYIYVVQERYSKKIKISWDRDHPLSGDYEFWYNVRYAFEGVGVKISYKGYITLARVLIVILAAPL